ncbi:MAG: PqqD family peptide modification chaperone [Alistipes sp.]|nr:PqqD family peptide modification chaperone [Alistipes sp.]MBQ8853453.1 PqqD family peptide modification chaperone [Alistipes sp.]
MKLKEGYKIREIAGEHVIIKQGRFGADLTRVIALNATSVLLWEQLQGREFEVEDVIKVLTDNYEVEEAVAAADASTWVSKLKECDLVE